MCKLNIISHFYKILPKDLDSSPEPTQWSLRRSIGEAGIGIILWLQHQPCGEVDVILHLCGLWAFKCSMDYQNQSNYQNQLYGCGDVNSTNVCQAEGRDRARHHVLRPLLALHRVGLRRPRIITYIYIYGHKEVMYFHLTNFTDACYTPYIASRSNFAVLIKYWRRKIIT